jgi:DNA-binding CsgD family transcriptional regulator
MRLDARDEAAAQELARGLRTFEDGVRPALSWLTAELRQLMRADRLLAYSVAPAVGGYRLGFAYGSGFPVPIHDALREALADRSTPWALFDPTAPEPRQRNVVVDVPLPHMLGDDRYFRRLGLDPRKRERFVRRMSRLNQNFLRRLHMNDMCVCRTLICDGGTLLAWLGACRPEPFSSREHLILRRLLPGLIGRLRTEQLVGAARLHSSAFTVALDALAVPAMLLDARGGIAHANAAGQEWLAAHSRDELDGFERVPVAAAGMETHHLAILRGASETLSRLALARSRWGLTSREAEVLAPVVRGETNQAIADALGCTVRAVELHMTHLMEKAGVANRAALIARFFGGA